MTLSCLCNIHFIIYKIFTLIITCIKNTGVSTLLYFNYASSDSLETSLASGFIVGKNNISLMLG